MEENVVTWESQSKKRGSDERRSLGGLHDCIPKYRYFKERVLIPRKNSNVSIAGNRQVRLFP